jgi:ABC transporter, permease protein, putative
MHNILLIINREITIRVRKKSFLVSTFLVPLLFAGLMVLPSLLALWDSGKHYTIGVVDNSNAISDSLHTAKNLTYVKEKDSIADIQTYLQEKGYEGLLVIGKNIMEDTKDVAVYSLRTLAMDASERIDRDLQKIVRKQRITSYQIEGLEDILKKTDVEIDVRAVVFNEKGEEAETNSGIALAISYILGGLIYGLIAASGAMVMSGVIEEKNNRIVEVLVSSVRSFDLMMGKILGIALVFLIQIVAWIILTLIIVTVAGNLLNLGASDMSQVASTMSSVDASGSGLIAKLEASGSLQEILKPLQNINISQLVVVFLFFFFGGYFLYASMYAAIGSAVEEASDAQQLILPVTIPLIIGFVILMNIGRSPDSSIGFWFSMIPLTSPIIMPARVAYGVDTWEVLLSGVILLITFVFVTWMASRIYRHGILQYGKKFGWKDMAKWMKR